MWPGYGNDWHCDENLTMFSLGWGTFVMFVLLVKRDMFLFG